MEGIPRFIDALNKFTFHYVTILIREVNRRSKSGYIYIPLCYYSNIKRVKTRVLDILIYIPLCYYSNDVFSDSFRALSRFTFHYVTILIHFG